MNYRDPNNLFKTNEVVGRVDTVVAMGEIITVEGSVSAEAMALFGINQVLILDMANRFVQEQDVGGDGRWKVEISPQNIGNDNAARKFEAFALSSQNNFLFALLSDPALVKNYDDFVSTRLPENSKDIPSFKKELRELIIAETQKPYVSRSIRDAISTGNNYQTLALENTLRQGGRQSRERFLFQIDFRNKSVLDVGANTGENSRIVRRLGASLVDGYEYDPFFVETGRAVNALTGMTRVSLFQGDCTRPELFEGMKYDIVLALAVWVYIKDTIREIAKATNVIVFETHTLDHGIEAYYQPLVKHFSHIVSLGYSDLPKDPHKSRMFMVCGKSREVVDKVLRRRFLVVQPYFNNRFIDEHSKLSRDQIRELGKSCYEKHVERTDYTDRERQFGDIVYFELFLAGLYQFWENEGKVKGLVDEDNLYLRYLRDCIDQQHIDPNFSAVNENPAWLIRNVSNKYEDSFNIINGHVDRVAPIEVNLDDDGGQSFETTDGEYLTAHSIDGHHRFFMCQLAGVDKVHYVVAGAGGETLFPQLYENKINTNYTLKIA
jgi:SAM-dependent methyltransferase